MLDTWTTYDGRHVRFSELDNFYLINLLHYVKRRADDAAATFDMYAQDENVSGDILFIAGLLDKDWEVRYNNIRNILLERGFYV